MTAACRKVICETMCTGLRSRRKEIDDFRLQILKHRGVCRFDNLQSEINNLKSLLEETLSYIQFLGAAGTVTRSRHLVNTSPDGSGKAGFQVLIDCGMFQGAKEWRLRNWQALPGARAGIGADIT